MKANPLDLFLGRKIKLDKKFYFISGNENSLIERSRDFIINKLKNEYFLETHYLDNIKFFKKEIGLFSDKSLYIIKESGGLDDTAIKNLLDSNDIFLFIFENSPKINSLKTFFSKRSDAFVFDCYELDRKNKMILLNDFIKKNNILIDDEKYWMLVERLDSKYGLLENDLNKIKILDPKHITLRDLKNLMNIEKDNNEKIFFQILKNNSHFVTLYKERIASNKDVNDLFYYSKFFCLQIIASQNEDQYARNIPRYLFREKAFLIDIYKKYNSKKKTQLLRLLNKTEKIIRMNNELSLMIVLRFLLGFKRISIS
tara:strand:- start:173 stop:1111 length:939 start_codon:yes stop_codon:yes gene_type:complete